MIFFNVGLKSQSWGGAVGAGNIFRMGCARNLKFSMVVGTKM